MKKLLALSLVGGGLLLLTGCACDEMCEAGKKGDKPATAALHRKKHHETHHKEAKPKKAKKKKIKKVKPVKVKKPKLKPVKVKKVKQAKKKKHYSHAYEEIDRELAEHAPWTKEHKEIVDAHTA